MAYIIEGTVEAISLKEMPSPDRYDNTHRMSILLNGDWYSVGATKGGTYINKDVKELTKNSVVNFKYEQNGDFKNIKKPTFEVTQKGESTPPAARTNVAQGSASSGVNPAAVGQCLNIGLELGILNKDNLFDPNAQREAIITYKKVKDELTNLWDAADNEPSPGAQENINEFDDAVPF